MDFSEKIRFFAKNKFKTLRGLGKAIGKTEQQLQKILSGETKNPGKDFFDKMREVGCDLNWLLDENLQTPFTTNNEAQKNMDGKFKLRLEAAVPAGNGDIVDFTGWVEEEMLDFNYDDHRLLQIDEEFGDSMKPWMHPGDFIIISFSSTIRNKDVVAARWDETKGAIKVVNFLKDDPDKIVLTSFNQNVSPIILSRNKVNLYKIAGWIPNKRRL